MTDFVYNDSSSLNEDELVNLDIEIDTFEYNEEKLNSVVNDIDPDKNFYRNITNVCKYHQDLKFATNDTFSIIHFNSRSLQANFEHVKDYLEQLNASFSVVAISETCLKDELNDNFVMKGYDMYKQNRKDKNGGGVALLISSNLECEVINNMTTVVEDVM